MTREEAIERFNGIINAMSISIAQSKFYPSKAELDELCDMAIEALSADAVPFDVQLQSTREVIDRFAEDRIKVVRCKDCDNFDYAFNYCNFLDAGVEGEDFFCAYGERREP